jgi:hypothetical protein
MTPLPNPEEVSHGTKQAVVLWLQHFQLEEKPCLYCKAINRMEISPLYRFPTQDRLNPDIGLIHVYCSQCSAILHVFDVERLLAWAAEGHRK